MRWDRRVYPSAPPETPMDRFAWSLREHRYAMGLTLQEMTDATGIPMQTLSHWETARAEAGFVRVIVLADFFGITMDEMLGRGEDAVRRVFAG